VDAGETRVAVLEGKGTARSGGKPRPSSDRAARGRGAEQAARDGGDFKVAELYERWEAVAG